jgi:hypothetical protein
MSTNYSQPPQPQKKGMGPLGWIAIGCGILFVLGAVVLGVGGYFAKKGLDKFSKNPGKTAAELLVRANPDLELVSTDDAAGTMTVRDKKNNKTVTMNFDDIKNGKFKMTTSEGTTTIDASGANGTGSMKVTDEKGQTATFGGGVPQNLPSWIPTYPAGTATGSFAADNKDARSGAFTVTSKDDLAKVASYYESQLKAGGLTVEKNMISSNDKTTGGTITGTSADKKHTVNIIVSSSDTGTQAVITFEEKK